MHLDCINYYTSQAGSLAYIPTRKGVDFFCKRSGVCLATQRPGTLVLHDAALPRDLLDVMHRIGDEWREQYCPPPLVFGKMERVECSGKQYFMLPDQLRIRFFDPDTLDLIAHYIYVSTDGVRLAKLKEGSPLWERVARKHLKRWERAINKR